MRSSVMLVCLTLIVSLWAEEPKAPFDAAVVARGAKQFKSSCGFCHGDDASGSRAPDLIRSAILSHDMNGDLLAPVIRNGRPDKGMPAFASLSAETVAGMIVFLHSRAYEALNSGDVPSDYPLKKLLTGNAEKGKEYFNGAGGCVGCHSPSGDFAKIATKYKPIDLQQRIVYPEGKRQDTAKIVLADGRTFEGKLRHADEFDVAIETSDGWYHSWPRKDVTVEIHDPLAAHRALTEKYTDSDIHNLFAYLETLN